MHLHICGILLHIKNNNLHYLFLDPCEREKMYIKKGLSLRVNSVSGAVGLYVPGGTAVLPSTALMLSIPAKIAGCKTGAAAFSIHKSLWRRLSTSCHLRRPLLPSSGQLCLRRRRARTAASARKYYTWQRRRASRTCSRRAVHRLWPRWASAPPHAPRCGAALGPVLRAALLVSSSGSPSLNCPS